LKIYKIFYSNVAWSEIWALLIPSTNAYIYHCCALLMLQKVSRVALKLPSSNFSKTAEEIDKLMGGEGDGEEEDDLM
jgi:hypothetical protein